MSQGWGIAEGLSNLGAAITCGMLAIWLGYLVFELRRRERPAGVIVFSGVLSALLLGAALLRPVRVTTRGTELGPRVVVLVDRSRRLELPAEGKTKRSEVALQAAAAVSKHLRGARVSLLGFGEGAPEPLSLADPRPKGSRLSAESDLSAALGRLAEEAGERPKAVVVVSDGRLARPGETSDSAALSAALGGLGVPIHTVRVADAALPDASIRSVKAAGAAVAHQPLALTVEIGCGGGLACGEIPVRVRELRQGAEPAVLASGTAKVQDDTATVELSITLERAGARIVEVSIESPQGDAIPENDARILTFSVARERVRLLHVAGRPTYDVRALRMWLKSDESVDLVAFFILRTEQDSPQTTDDSELALIPFPVDELFTEHLPSFDAVILQDIDAVTYKLEQHLPALASYVQSGGGLIMVGGPSAFAGGGYAGTPLEKVLPVEFSGSEQPFDTVEFEPRLTEAGRVAPVLRGLRELFGEQLPRMTGSNTLGRPAKSAIVLWEHPERKAHGEPMPVLAFGEAGDGRSIALGVDGTHQLGFSEFGEAAAGRGYGALWDGLLGWLMRDPRYEAARMDLLGDCVAGEPVRLRLLRLPGTEGAVELEVTRLGTRDPQPQKIAVEAPPSGPIEIEIPSLEAGGYTARARIGAAPPTRHDFACESGGIAFSDSRPDPERLKRIAAASSGRSVTPDRIDQLPSPPATEVAAERRTTPLLPSWAWTLLASCALGWHWVARRRAGLT